MQKDAEILISMSREIQLQCTKRSKLFPLEIMEPKLGGLMEERRYSGDSSMTGSADFAMQVRIRTYMALPRWKTSHKRQECFSRQTTRKRSNLLIKVLTNL